MTRIPALLVVLALLCRGAMAQTPLITVLINHAPVNFDQPPVVVANSVLVPMRGVFEGLGADVVWIPDHHLIRATHGQTTVELQLGATTARINGEAHTLTTPAISVGGRTMVPLRFISEALGAEVRWSPATRTVAITVTAPAAPHPVASGPAIERVTTDARLPLRPGQTVSVRLQGEPGCQASFDLSGLFSHVPMSEVAPGRYQGSVQVPYNAQTGNLDIVGYLEDPRGQSSQAAEASAPPPAEFVRVRPADNEVLHTARPRVQVEVEGGNGLDPASVRLTVDGHDVSNEATLSRDAISWVPSFDLPAGVTTVMVSARDGQANRLQKQWSFTIAGAASDGRIYHNGNHLLTPGEVLTVTMEGEPDGQASFDMESRHVPMAEVAPGRYVGTYQVQPGDQWINARLEGRLSWGPGRPAVVLEAAQPVSMGYPVAPRSVLPLELQSPTDQAPVEDHFLIAGQTAPGALVSITVRHGQGPQYNSAQTLLNTQVVAGLNGYFEFPFEGQVRGGEFVVTVRSTLNGQPSGTVVVTVPRQ